jgi:hypothetical protein
MLDVCLVWICYAGYLPLVIARTTADGKIAVRQLSLAQVEGRSIYWRMIEFSCFIEERSQVTARGGDAHRSAECQSFRLHQPQPRRSL